MRRALLLSVLLAGCASREEPRSDPTPSSKDLLQLLREARAAHKRLQADPSLENDGDFREEAEARAAELRPHLKARYADLMHGGLLVIVRQKAENRDLHRRVIVARLETFGVKGARVFEQIDDVLLVFAPAGDAFQAFARTRAWVLTQGMMEFCLVAEDAKTEGLRAVTWQDEVLALHRPSLDGRAVAAAEARGPEVRITLTEEGSRGMRELTSKNLQKRLAILVDGNVLMAPRIEATIEHEAVITGQFTGEETRRLAALLELGPLPERLQIAGEVPIGPTPGGDPFADGPATRAWRTLMSTPVGLAVLEDVIRPGDPDFYEEVRREHRRR